MTPAPRSEPDHGAVTSGQEPTSRLTIAVSLFACDHGRSGIGRYMVALLGTMLAAAPEHRWHVWVAEEDVTVFPFLDPGRRPPGVTLHVVANGWNRPIWSLLWHAAVLPAELRGLDVDVLYLPAGNRRLAPFSPVPTLAVVHDLSSFHVKGKYDPLRMVYITRVMPWLIRRSGRVVAVSRSSARDVVELARYPEARLSVVGLGYDRGLFRPLPRAECVAELRERLPELPIPFFVYVSRIEHPGKNHVGLLRAYRRVLDRAPDFAPSLVFAGSRKERADEVDRAIAELDLAGRVHVLGFVPDDLLPVLYGAAGALVFPSLFEGFGLPIVEAQACGLPVAAADISSLPEVAGEGALLFDPHDPDDMASTLLRLAGDPQLVEDLRRSGLENARRFTWEAAAEATLALLVEAAGAR